jgi:MFS transporter, ACS family, hexuronate transporter
MNRAHNDRRSGGQFRWVICGLLFLATTINYMDRQIIGILKSSLSGHFHWTENDYGDIVAAFQIAYALGYLFVGRMMDWTGVKRGFPLAVGLWSIAAAMHGLLWFVPVAASVACFSGLRVVLGVFEGGNFPASIKVAGEWFPTKERALATGIFNSGTNIGAIICPAIVPWIGVHWGWPASFYIVGALGFLWIGLWWMFYDSPGRHRRLSEGERAYIESDQAGDERRSVSWIGLLRFRAVWAFAAGMLLTSPVWWFYLFWIPGFLQKRFDLSESQVGLPVILIYVIAIVGSVGGGWLPKKLLSRGMGLNRARKFSMLVCAVCILPVCFASVAPHLWISAAIVGVAAAAHQGWAANLYTLVSDTMPKSAVSSVVGIGGLAGGLAGAVAAKVTGMVLDATGGDYFRLFVAVSMIYLLALLIIQILVPRLGAESSNPDLTQNREGLA